MNKQNYQKTFKNWILQKKDWLIVIILSMMGFTLIYQGLENQKKKIGLDSKVVEVLIVNRMLEKGELFQASDFTKEIMPEKYVPIGALYPSDAPKFAGQTLSRTINKGEILLSNALDIEFALDNPSSRIQEGYRALAIPVDDIASIAGTIEAGDHIDLLTTLEVQDGTPTTMTLLQNITVLATGNGIHNQDGYSTMTLMVLPSEAPLIMHTLKTHDLSIILRNPYDQETRKDLPMISKNDMIEAGFLNHIQSERDRKIQILRGSQNPF